MQEMLTHAGGIPRNRIVGCGLAAALFASIAAVQMLAMISHPGEALYVAPVAPHGAAADLLANHRDTQATTGADGWAIGGFGDTLRSLYTTTWWSHRLLQSVRLPSFYDANTLFPTPQALTYSDLQLGVVPWFAPVYAMSGNPVLAYQISLYGGTVGCALLFFVLLQSWTGSTMAGVLAGIASIVAPYRLRSAPLLYLHFILYLPIALLCIDMVSRARRSVVPALGLLTSIVLQASSSGYLAYVTFVLVPIHALVAILEAPREVRGRVAAILCGIGIVAGVGIAVMYRPFAQHAVGGTFGPVDSGGVTYSPWMALLWTMPRLNLTENVAHSFGLPLLGLAGLGLLNHTGHRYLTGLLTTAAGVLLLLGPSVSVGPITLSHLPWEWLARLVPGFNIQRHPYFPVTLTGIGLTLLAGQGTAWLIKRANSSRAWTLVGVTLAGACLWTYGDRLSPAGMVMVATGSNIPAEYRWLAEHGEGLPLLELPISPTTEGVYQYFSTVHWLPSYNGTFAYAPRTYAATRELAIQVLSPDPAAADRFLRDIPVAWVLLHEDLLPNGMRNQWRDSPSSRLKEVARFGPAVVLRVPPRED